MLSSASYAFHLIKALCQHVHVVDGLATPGALKHWCLVRYGLTIEARKHAKLPTNQLSTAKRFI